MSDDDGFLARWSKRKAALREGQAVPEPAPADPVAPVTPVVPLPTQELVPETEDAPPQAKPPPTLDDVAKLVAGDDVRRFVAPDVDPAVRNAALKKLFAEPNFNVMDGLDTYIDDYGKPNPIPESMLRKMVQSQMLGLFADKPDDPDTPDATRTPSTHDPDPAVRLQPDDAAGPSGPAQGTQPDPGREP